MKGKELVYYRQRGIAKSASRVLGKMTNYNFIGIGINHYQYLQPLTYAQADIQTLNSFFCEEVRVNPEKTLIFTDNSSWINEQPTYPTKKNLTKWIQQGFQLSNKTKPYGSSVLWFAFSGYGIQHNGEDYLLPVDGKLQDPAGTGIPVREVFAALKQQGAAKIIALMDMNRSTAAMGNGKVGEQTLELAGKMGIAAVLSCKPDEFSHETSALGHGMFTAAMLEALRYYRSDLTLELLNNYLGDRLKELSDHHWRPLQTPVMVIPSLAANRELILPTGDATKVHWQMAVPMGASLAGMHAGFNGDRPDLKFPPLTNGHGQSSHIMMGTSHPDSAADPDDEYDFPVADDFGEDTFGEDTFGEDKFDAGPEIYHDFGIGTDEAHLRADFHESDALDVTEPDDEPVDAATFFADDVEPEVDPTQPVLVPDSFGNPKKTERQKTDRPWYLAGWQWLGLLLYLILGGLGWRFFGGNIPEPQVMPPIPTEVTEEPQAGENSPNNSNAGQPVPVTPPKTQTEIVVDPEPESSPTPKAGTTQPKGAIQAGQTTPPPLTSPVQPTSQAQNERILTEANLVLRSSQASSFNQAINAARAVKPGTPLYEEARTQINRWSRVILDIAEARALRGDYSGAIAAALLVPKDDAQVYGIAQNSIKTWQSQLTVVKKNRQVIVNAQELIIPYQASSYSRAIALLKTIKPNEPVYAEARALQDQWSRTIYLLANSRAAKQKFKLAVETAKLVAPDSPSYKSAQGAIARWQKQVH